MPLLPWSPCKTLLPTPPSIPAHGPHHVPRPAACSVRPRPQSRPTLAGGQGQPKLPPSGQRQLVTATEANLLTPRGEERSKVREWPGVGQDQSCMWPLSVSRAPAHSPGDPGGPPLPLARCGEVLPARLFFAQTLLSLSFTPGGGKRRCFLLPLETP